MTSTRCAACKQLRRRCPSDCIFLPYFPPNNPQRFSCVHRIYGASNVGKMLQQVQEHQRADVADTLYYEAYCRIKDPVYGCVGIITVLHEEIYQLQCQLAKLKAEIDLLKTQSPAQGQQVEFSANLLADQNGVYTSSPSLFDPSFYWFY
ncbi:PREDICTED: LOB domain-containing protein 24-like [Nicotiana attenuata]|uniref:Lob domain-containing protein 24 n=1 Tax=Nicotiana attenuata TaxID=49451 RepID=A0A1J6KI98_NICAT|nr:PREDICTED: LOB domain-containing protein 24-like [Nicotiana attenuata]OIT21583.1 lob domain-containing protein 24 [Nicotiana attenuata]